MFFTEEKKNREILILSRRWYWLVLGATGSVWGGTGWYFVVLGQYRSGLVDILWCCVRTGQYWLVLDGAGSVEGGTGWYWVVLGHYRVVLVETLRYWVSIGGTGWYFVVLGQCRMVLVGI